MNKHVWSRRVAPGARNAWGRERERAKGPSPSYSWASSNAMQMKGFLYLLSSILGVWKAAWRLVQGDTRYTIQERRAEWTGSVCVCFVLAHVCMCVQCWAFRGSDGLRAARPSLLTNTYTLLSHKPWCLSEISHTVKKIPHNGLWWCFRVLFSYKRSVFHSAHCLHEKINFISIK